MEKPPIVLIHGMFMTALCWEKWIPLLEAAGYVVVAPCWPGREGRTVEELRADGDSEKLAELGLADLVAFFVAVVKAQPQPPIMIGHSLGGLTTQLVMQQVPVRAAVLISSAPPQGVFVVSWDFVKMNAPMMLGRKARLMPFDVFCYAFANSLSEEEARVCYDRYAVPESRKVPQDSVTKTGKVDFAAPHPPLLFVCGDKDQIVPSSLCRKNYQRFSEHDAANGSRSDYLEFPGRTHLIIAEPSFQPVVVATLDWITQQLNRDCLS